MNRSTLVTGTLALGLALGWSLRESQWAAAQGKLIPSSIVNIADVKMEPHLDSGKPVGEAGLLVDGETAGTKSMQVGRFLLPPGMQPHPPHRHVAEEVLIVTRGSGEIVCDGKTVPVKPGAVMFSEPNVEHGIKNTGERPLEFYWVKYQPRN
jgi:mannose-6-phosphate isomerase-like protein (cupin superfamily)